MYPSDLIHQGNIPNIIAETKDKEKKRCFLESLACCDKCPCGSDLDEWSGLCLLRRKTDRLPGEPDAGIFELSGLGNDGGGPMFHI